MRNPLTGLEVAGIEGIEFVTPVILQHNRVTGSSNNNNLDTENWMSRSYYSRKVFIYVDPKNRTAPITQFRVNKLAPNRPVNPLKILYESKLFSMYTNFFPPRIHLLKPFLFQLLPWASTQIGKYSLK